MSSSEFLQIFILNSQIFLWAVSCSPIEIAKPAPTPQIPQCISGKRVRPDEHPYIINASGRAEQIKFMQFQARKRGVAILNNGPALRILSIDGKWLYFCETDFSVFGPNGESHLLTIIR